MLAAELERSRGRPTDVLRAYELRLRALPMVQVSTSLAAVEDAMALLHLAIAMDGSYVDAKALYVYAHAVAFASSWLDHEQAMRALPMADDVLLDHRDNPFNLGHAGDYMAYVGGQREKGLAAMDRALALNPNSFEALHSSGWIRPPLGDAPGAIALLQRALRANPLAPEVGHGLSSLGHAHMVDGQLDRALKALQKVRTEAPAFGITQTGLAWTLGRLAKRDEAAAVAARLCTQTPRLRVVESLALAVLDTPPTSNPAEDARGAKVQKPPPDPFSREEADKIVAAMTARFPARVANLVATWFWTGMRTSKIVGRRWSNVNLTSATLSVTEAQVRGVRKLTTKTNAARTVKLDGLALAALERQAVFTAEQCAAVFPDPHADRSCDDERAFHRSFWTPVLKDLAICCGRTCNMALTHATVMLMAGMNCLFCAKQLGHSVEMLLRTQSKWIDGTQHDRAMQLP